MKTIQIRNVPDDVHRTPKQRAATERMSLSACVLREIERSARRQTMEEVLGRIKGAGPVSLPEDSATIIRQLRDAGDPFQRSTRWLRKTHNR